MYVFIFPKYYINLIKICSLVPQENILLNISDDEEDIDGKWVQNSNDVVFSINYSL